MAIVDFTLGHEFNTESNAARKVAKCKNLLRDKKIKPF